MAGGMPSHVALSGDVPWSRVVRVGTRDPSLAPFGQTPLHLPLPEQPDSLERPTCIK